MAVNEDMTIEAEGGQSDVRKATMSQECRQPLETGIGKQTDFPPGPPEATQPC